MATKTDILNALAEEVANYPIGSNEDLTGAQETELCDRLAGVLETVNPNHNYPPTPR